MTHHKPIIFLFSGQGSHYYQMGRELFEQHACFKHWMLLGEDFFKNQTNLSLLEELYSDKFKKADNFTRTLFTHSAIFILQYALAQTLISEGISPDLVLGTSLGEFAAATIAGCMDFETAFKTVILQAQLIENHCIEASMTAVLYSSELYVKQAFLHQYSELASINFNQHFVLSSSIANLENIEGLLKEHKIAYQRLAVNHGFHSQYIDPAKNYFLEAIQRLALTLTPPTLPLISCAEAKSLSSINVTHLWEVIKKPIQFQKTILELEKLNNYIYLDVGPAGTLTTFAKYNLASHSQSITLHTLTPDGNDLNNIIKIKSTLNL